MIDLSTVEIVTAIPEKMLALEAANQLLANDNRALQTSNQTLKYLAAVLGISLGGLLLFLLVKHMNKKDEETENKMPPLNCNAPAQK